MIEVAESARTSAEAAAALGCPLGAIAKSLVFIAHGEPILVLASGVHQIDLVGSVRESGASSCAAPRPMRCARRPGISLVVERGEIVTLLGANGAGKTTTLRTISGLQRAHSGSIVFNGRPIQEMAAHDVVGSGSATSPRAGTSSRA